MQIKLSEVIEAIENTDSERQYFYFIPEERIIEKGDEPIKEKYLIPLPSHKEIDDYGTMRRYVEEVAQGEAQEWLSECIKGVGAFRRFRSTLERFQLTDDWLDFRDEVHEQLAVDWCEYYGIEYLEDQPIYASSAPEPVKTDTRARHNYRFIDIDEDNAYGLAYLVIEFRKVLAGFKNMSSNIEPDEAVDEIRSYLKHGWPVFALADNGRYIGYGVCRIEDDVVWLESIYVRNEYRHRGVGKMLFERAEGIAKEYGNDYLYQFVHPNNDAMISFLAKNGYDVLNLLEIRKADRDEETDTTYTIGDHTYRY